MSSASMHLPSARSATIRAMLLVLVGSLGMQFSAVIAVGLFPVFGVLGTSALRMVVAAVLLLIIFRPRLRGRTRREWSGIVLYGVAMAAMNAFLYLAFDRLPLGIATTIDFLGPCLVALAASRRLREGMLAVVALIGVGLIAGFGGELDPLGLFFAALAGAAFGLYTLLAARVGQSDGGLPSVALSVTVAAVLTLPFSAPAMPLVRVEHLLPLFASAVLGTALAFTVDTIAGRLTSARVLGVFFAFDPVVGTILGALLLDQLLTPVALGGILLVVAAGAGIVWLSGGHGPAAESAGERRVD
ncbi:DMT family transporter [Leucobacter sp. PH1c]|uniref:EamA family transporter n=1 Tax=Leucobacter sp. PH1c TaxID=1397278 RepID=UPI000AC95B63|nr:EamA family transporter [Leucobacter sp. PH1c]